MGTQVIDMNVKQLSDADLTWADYVFTSTMVVQKASFYEVVRRCNRFNTPVIAGGPHPTSYQDEIKAECGGKVSHFVAGEVEHVFADFLTDLQKGTAAEVTEGPRTAKIVQTDVTKTPIPRFDLINVMDYVTMGVQFSRGCPFNCEFCDITKLFGRIPRTKTNEQFLAEFDRLYELGWRDEVFVVDDNFIGNKRDTLRLLPAIAAWQKERNYPFSLLTETSVNLVNIPGMLEGMVDAGFGMTFLGIESPNEEALQKTAKKQNTGKEESTRDYLLRAVQTIQSHGLEVTAGFIVGLDGDKEFQSHIDFIQEAGIPRAMAGLLTALKKTNLYNRLESEGRLLHESSGNNVSVELNFVPELDRDELIAEYKRILRELYDPSLKNYFDRCLTLFEHLKPRRGRVRIRMREMRAFAKSIRYQLLSPVQGPSYLWFLLRVLWRYPRMFPMAVCLAVMGYHFEKLSRQQVAVDDFKQYLASELDSLRATLSRFARVQSDRIGGMGVQVQQLLARVQTHHKTIHADFRHNVQATLESFQQSVVKRHLEAEFGTFKQTVSQFAKDQSDRIGDARRYAQELVDRLYAQYDQSYQDFQHNFRDTLDAFQRSVNHYLEQRFA
jgi:radical SAM superfamily enzyme YgiQ (UPF0313 family)